MSHVDDAHNATHPPRNVASTGPDEGSLQYTSSGAPIPPTAHIHPTTRSHHGHDVVDNYEWLRDKESPETLAYLRAENEYTEARTRDLAPLQDSIFHEIKSRTQETDLSVPVRSGDWWYYGRSLEGKSYGVSCRVPASSTGDKTKDWTPPAIDAESAPENEQIILDSNVLAEGAEFFSLGASSVSVDGNYLAYSTDTTGDERFDLRIKDLRTGELLDDAIDGIGYGATWVGSEWLFYERVDDSWRPNEVWRHRVGTPTDQDVCIFREDDERFWVGCGTTRSEKYLFVEVGSKVTSEVWFLDLGVTGDGKSKTVHPQRVTGELQCILPRHTGVQYDVDHAVIGGDDRWIVLHNAHGADFELGMSSAAPLTSLDDLDVVIPHKQGRRIEGMDVFAQNMVVGYRENAINKLGLFSFADGTVGNLEPIDFDEELYSAGTGGNAEWESPYIRMAYESFVTPGLVFDYDLATGERLVRKQRIVKGGYDPSDYVARRMWTTARDGAKVPVSLIYRAGLEGKTDSDGLPTGGPHPTILYGYGSYEASMDPAFSIARLSLLDRGIVFAIAHVRGGGEMGRSWYDNGKTLAKKNTFYDFIDVADDLISRNVTDNKHMVALGGSAGGLLMGAVANMAGDRFSGIEAVVPFVDPLTSILMPELPLTVIEWDEWGDPLHDPEVYDYMASYAPYDNVSADNTYPPILALTSLNDTRVLYVEPAKWVAKIRATIPGADVCLKTEMIAGHGGVSGRYEQWKQTAFEYAWMIRRAGVAEDAAV
ncbi:S9 family peptidase [Corynebacterium parakroppenstedtii]|uniref:S9 family peptidase n=1 Tax=Corynebacterium parakroppenstedtii TaxID=2828363 RepID=UPI001FD3B6CD|nr:S9 family peptidase [Corynebacterium parakroppenstedtii]